jgi:hypothetical protein
VILSERSAVDVTEILKLGITTPATCNKDETKQEFVMKIFKIALLEKGYE